MNFRESSMSSGYAAAITMATIDNGAHALVGDGARLMIGGKLNVVAEAKDPHQFSASGNVGLLGSTSDTNIGGALVYAKPANQATAFVGYNATVDVAKQLAVTSTATVDSPVDPFDLVMALLGLGPATQAEALGAAHAYTEQLKTLVKDKLDVDASEIDISDYLADVLSDESKIGTTFVHAGGSASGGLKIGGGITVLFPYNSATSAIAKGSQVNQRLATAPVPADQDVDVSAVASIESVNLAGHNSVLNYVKDLITGEQADKAFGGFFTFVICQNFAIAYIDDLAIVSADGDIRVASDASAYLLSIAQAGDKAAKIGVDGAVLYDRITSNSRAYIEDRAVVDAGQNLDVLATSDIDAITIGGGLGIGTTAGVGISAAFTDIRDHTVAFIGDSQEPLAPETGLDGFGGELGSVRVAGNLSVIARSTPAVWTIAVSGGVAQDTDDGSGPAGSSEGGQFGLGLSGDVAFNFVDHDTLAFIRDAVRVTIGGQLIVEADGDDLLMVAGAGAVAYGKHLGIGGSYAHNDLDQITDAYTDNIIISPLSPQMPPDLKIYAHAEDNTVVTVAVGGAGAKKIAAVAGSVTNNPLDIVTHACLGNGTVVQDARDITVQAEHRALVVSVAGSVAVAYGDAVVGVGAAVTLGFIDSTVDAWIAATADVHQTRDLQVLSSQEMDTFSLAASLAASTDTGLGAAGSVSLLDVDTTTRAYVAAQTLVAGGNIQIAADNDDDMFLLAVGGAYGADVGVGLSNTTLLRTDTVEAFIGAGADVTSRGTQGVSVTALSDEAILTISVGGAASGEVAVAASAVVNDVTENTTAYVGLGAKVQATNASPSIEPSLTVRAYDNTRLLGIAGALSGAGSVAVGAGADVGLVTKRTQAYLAAGVDVDADGDIRVVADSAEELLSFAVAGGGAGSVSVMGSAGVYLPDITTRAFVGDDPDDGVTYIGTTDVHAHGTVLIAADDDLELDLIAGSAGGAGTVGIGASGGVNVVTKKTEAFIGPAARVTGDAMRPTGLDVHTGQFVVSYQSVPALSSGGSITFDPHATTQPDTITRSQGSWTSDGFQKGDTISVLRSEHNDGKYRIEAISPDGRTLTILTETDKNSLQLETVPAGDIGIYRVASADGEVDAPRSGSIDSNHDGQNDQAGDDFSKTRSTAPATRGERCGRDGHESGRHRGVCHQPGRRRDGGRQHRCGGDDRRRGHTSLCRCGSQGQREHVLCRRCAGRGACRRQRPLSPGCRRRSGGSRQRRRGAGRGCVGHLQHDGGVCWKQCERPGKERCPGHRARGRGPVVHRGWPGGFRRRVAGRRRVGAVDRQHHAGLHWRQCQGDGGRQCPGRSCRPHRCDHDRRRRGDRHRSGGAAGSVGVVTIDKLTQAWIGSGASVDGRGHQAGLAGIYSGLIQQGAFATETMHGVAVQAASSEQVFDLAVAGAGGLFVGLAGGVTVTLLDSDTSAFVALGAKVNLDTASTNALQGVNVSAANLARATTFAGAGGGGIVGLAGAIDVGSMKNDTSAFIAGDAQVQAEACVDVHALSIKEVESFAFSGAGGLVGLAGSVSVWSLGASVEKTYQDNDGGSANSLQGDNGSADQFAGTQAGSSSGTATGLLNNYHDPGDGQTNASRMSRANKKAGARAAAMAPTAAEITSAIRQCGRAARHICVHCQRCHGDRGGRCRGAGTGRSAAEDRRGRVCRRHCRPRRIGGRSEHRQPRRCPHLGHGLGGRRYRHTGRVPGAPGCIEHRRHGGVRRPRRGGRLGERHQHAGGLRWHRRRYTTGGRSSGRGARRAEH